MAPKTVRSNFRVEVEPRSPGDFGFASIGGRNYSETEWESNCEEIATQIRRHIDGLPSRSGKGVRVAWDADRVCEHCGSDWTEKSDAYNGGCCSKDDEQAPEYDEQT